MKRQTTGGATREAVKEYLQQYHMARERRRILERRHDVLARELNAPAPGTTYRTMPASRPAADSEGAVSVVFRLSEVEERIEAQRVAMGRAVTMVMDLIDLLPENSMERTVVGTAAHRLQEMGTDLQRGPHEQVKGKCSLQRRPGYYSIQCTGAEVSTRV